MLWGFLITFVISFVVYLYAMAPSASFWDCGEYLSCAYCLGVPHPPGAPLNVILRKFFMLVIPFWRDYAARSNFMSVIMSAFAVGLLYIFAYKICKSIFAKREEEKEDRLNKILPHACAIAGALAAGFSFSFWHNAVESEAYAPATFFLILALWLALLWEENRNPRFLILSGYVMVLGMQVHWMALLAMVPVVFHYLYSKRKEIRKTENKNAFFEWLKIYLIGIVIFVIFIALPVTRALEVPLKEAVFGSLGIVLGMILMHIAVQWMELKYEKKMFLTSLILIIAGLSIYFYLLIRARHYPEINECEPTTLRALWDVFTRKQYGPEKALSLFKRKTCIKTGYPFIVGLFWQIHFYLKYANWQWLPWPREAVFGGYETSTIIQKLSVFGTTVMALTSIYGIYNTFKYNKKLFILIFGAYFMASFALIFYMNYKFAPSDPNPMHQPREVRERQYFFGPASALLSLFIGVGIYSLILDVRKYLRKASLILLGMGIVPLISNWHSHANRHKNYICSEYGKNMLLSCDKNAVLYTNGDNDTFPLWFAQTVLGVRKDVKIANLSLLNTNWYIKQLKRRGAPISLSDFQIDNLNPLPAMKDGKMVKGQILYVKDIAIRDMVATNAGLKFEPKLLLPVMVNTLPKKYRKLFKGRDIIYPREYVRILPKEYWFRLPEEYLLPKGEFEDLVLSRGYKGKIPIYFAVTVSEENTKGYNKYLRMEGLVRRIVPKEEAGFSIEKSESLLYKVYRYDSALDPEVYKDKNIKRLLSNYAAIFWALGQAYYRKGDIDNAIKAFEFGRQFKTSQKIPFDHYLAVLYMEKRDTANAIKYLKSAENIKSAEGWYLLGEFYLEENRKNYRAAENAFKNAVKANPKNPIGYVGLLRIYKETNQGKKLDSIISKCVDNAKLAGKILGFAIAEKYYDIAEKLVRKWLKKHPYDRNAKKLLDSLKTLKRRG